MKRPSREREREADELEEDNLEPKAVVRPAPPPRRAQPLPQQSWLRRYWVSIVGVSAGLIVSIWRFGIPQLPHRIMRPSIERAVTTAPFTWHGPIAAGHLVTVKGMNGGIHAGATDGSEVEVTAIKRSRDGRAAEVPIAVVQDGGDVTICSATPAAPNECSEGEGGPGGIVVEYNVRVPKGVKFAANSVNGGITVDGLSAAVELETVNGGIQLSTTGTARAETVNGSIRAAVGSGSEDMSFETVNGAIAVSIPDNSSVDVRAQTLSGSIRSDFPLDIPKTKPGEEKTATGRIGKGGNDLRLETVNGSIELERADLAGRLPPPPRPSRPGRRNREQ